MSITIYRVRPHWIVKTPWGNVKFDTEQDALNYARNLIN